MIFGKCAGKGVLLPTTTPSPFTGRERLCLLFLFIGAILLRLPEVLLTGRLFGEEGTFFFAYAWHGTDWQAFFHPLGGYFNIAASGTTLLAARLVQSGWLPLGYAPYLTIGASLAVQTMPAILILGGRAPWLNSKLAVLFALFVLAATPTTEEVWLQTLHIQFHLAVCLLIMIVTDPPEGWTARIGRALLALLAPLCGPASIALLPPMVVRSWLDAGRRRYWETGALAFGAAVQLLLFYTPSGVRGQSASPILVGAAVFVRHIVNALLGEQLARNLGGALLANNMVWLGALGALAVMAALVVLAIRTRSVDALLLLGMGLLVALISYHGGLLTRAGMMDVGFGQRYNFVPQVGFSFAVIALFVASTGGLRRTLGGIGCLMTTVCVVSFFNPSDFLAKGPDWRTQVHQWQADHDHRLAIWPVGWTMDLSDTDFNCGKGAVPEPDYCDAAWETRQHVELKEH